MGKKETLTCILMVGKRQISHLASSLFIFLVQSRRVRWAETVTHRFITQIFADIAWSAAKPLCPVTSQPKQLNNHPQELTIILYVYSKLQDNFLSLCVVFFSLKMECEKLASEKTEMQRHYVMVRSVWHSVYSPHNIIYWGFCPAEVSLSEMLCPHLNILLSED